MWAVAVAAAMQAITASVQDFATAMGADMDSAHAFVSSLSAFLLAVLAVHPMHGLL